MENKYNFRSCSCLVILCVTFIGAVTADCPEGEGWEQYNDNCYYFGTEELTREGAANVCANVTTEPSALVTVASKDIYDYLNSKNLNYDFWIGLRVSPDLGSDNNWYWSDTYQNVWTKWNNPSTNNPCVEIQNDGEWNSYTCLVTKHYVCKQARSGDCPSGWQNRDDWCYQLNTNSKGSLQAELDCLSKDGHLASIHSEEENNFVRTMLNSDNPAWIGLYGMKWDDGTTYSWNSFPAGGGPLVYQPCVRQQQNGDWIADYCVSLQSSHRFVCQTYAEGTGSGPRLPPRSPGPTDNNTPVPTQTASSMHVHIALVICAVFMMLL